MSTPHAIADWLHTCNARRLCTDSRQVAAGDAFIAWPGYASDARAYVGQAFKAGAVAVLVEADGLADSGLSPAMQSDPRVRAVRGLKAMAGPIAATFYGDPSAAMEVIAVTGTNGKTSIAWWLSQALRVRGQSCGIAGTLGMGMPSALMDTGLTTPDPVRLQAGLSAMHVDGVRACAIEASSIGIEEHRLNGVHIQTAIWSNLSQDHLDYHGDMATYAKAKEKLFDWPDLKTAVVNVGDAHGRELAARLAQSHPQLALWTVAQISDRTAVADLPRIYVSQAEETTQGVHVRVHEAQETCDAHWSVVGQYNVDNLLAVVATLRSLGYSLRDAVDACQSLPGVPGRLEAVHENPSESAVYVDYAHTPDAVEKALAALQRTAQVRGGKLWVILGCGGDRDAGKRPKMASAAYAGSDVLTLTSDNPRSEDPQAILDAMVAGLATVDTLAKPFYTQLLRDVAIAAVLSKARPADVVLIAGKGHETYQEVAGVRYPFSDAQVALAALRALRARAGDVFSDPAPKGAATGIATGVAMGAAMGPIACLPHLPNARLVGEPAHWPHAANARVHSDTRTLMAGDLFVALSGDHYDAHAFLPKLSDQGVQVALASHGLAQAGLVGVEVPDTRTGLGDWAQLWRHECRVPLIAVTGSNGKTTVTQMIASILRMAHGEAALATAGNFNNDIGLPLTILRLRSHHRSAVVELGMNHPGEIARLSAIAQPTVALVNNAQREHLEFMQTVDAVAEENSDVFNALPTDGIAVMPHGDAYTPRWVEKADGRTVWTFSTTDQNATVYAAGQWQGDAWSLTLTTPQGSAQVRLALAGEHNVANAAAAAACALAAGMALTDVRDGLTAFTAVKGRSRAALLARGADAVQLVDDTYNANPDSMRAAIDVLGAMSKPRWLVMGDMGEVGAQGEAFHREALSLALDKNIERIDVAGHWWEQVVTHPADTRAADRLHWHADVDALADAAPALGAHSASILVKGSRFMQMERVVASLEATWPPLGSAVNAQQKEFGGRDAA